MLDKHSRYIDQIKIEFDMKFIRSLSLLSKRKIEPIIINRDDEEIIVGIKCPVIMDGETFDEDSKMIESDILKAFASILNSKICNRQRENTIYSNIGKKAAIEYTPFPCPACGSIDTIGYGRRRTNTGIKPKRICRQCGKGYTNQKGAIPKMKNSRQVIHDAIELSKQFSLRETARRIKEKYNVKISHSIICIWRKNSELKNSELSNNLDIQENKLI